MQISADERHPALPSLESSKAPGFGDLPADLYKVFWSAIGGRLSKGHLPSSCRRAMLTLLPKKGDLQEINLRPAALLCTDYKLLSNVFAMRRRQVTKHILHVDQTYCLPNRLISDNSIFIRDVLDLSSSSV